MTHEEFQTHYRHISHIIDDFSTTFNDGRRIREETSQKSIVELTRMLHMLQQTADHFETSTKLVQSYPEDPEGPQDPFAPENPETWLIVKGQRQKVKEENM